MYAHFDEIVSAVRAHPSRQVLAIAGAEDRPVVEAALAAQKAAIAEPIFVGRRAEVASILKETGENPEKFRIEEAGAAGPAQTAVELVQSGEAGALMKGLIETRDMLKPVVSKENKLNTGRPMTHLAFFSLPNYSRLIACTDGGMMVYPTLDDKKHIIQNAASALHAMGYERPAIAVLAGIEKVNPKMKETVEADALHQMALRGEIQGCDVIGPISYDVAMSAEIAHHKGYECPLCGAFDVLVVPDLASGNILGKSLIISAGAAMAGIVIGAAAPIVLTSRGSTAQEKFYSIALASLVASGMKN